ncbi:MAG: PAS domain-containing protein [Marinosulfonomonas sp.]|nr:PAS domain-containing protein [Marinosulfonomonas sp.]
MNKDFPAIAQLEAYWLALRLGDEIPHRADVDPRGLEDVLEYAFVLERIAPGVARFRVAGSHLNDLMGMEVRGMPMSAMFEAGARKLLADTVESVVAGPRTARIRLTSKGSIGRAALSGGIYMAPLRDDQGFASRILGCLQTTGNPGHAPRRFEISSVIEQVSSVGKVCPLPTPAPVAMPGFAAPTYGFNHLSGKTPPSARPNLRLVADNT